MNPRDAIDESEGRANRTCMMRLRNSLASSDFVKCLSFCLPYPGEENTRSFGSKVGLVSWFQDSRPPVSLWLG